MSVYMDLDRAVKSSIDALHTDYENDHFVSCGSNIKFFWNINQKVEDLNRELIHTHKTFKQWEHKVFHVEPDIAKIEPFLWTVFDSQVKAIFDYSRSQDSIDQELWAVCDDVTFDVAMIEVLNWNTPLMDKEQKQTILS